MVGLPLREVDSSLESVLSGRTERSVNINLMLVEECSVVAYRYDASTRVLRHYLLTSAFGTRTFFNIRSDDVIYSLQGSSIRVLTALLH